MADLEEDGELALKMDVGTQSPSVASFCFVRCAIGSFSPALGLSFSPALGLSFSPILGLSFSPILGLSSSLSLCLCLTSGLTLSLSFELALIVASVHL
jgi:hypothetical protein